MSRPDDPLRNERDVFLAAAIAAIGATLETRALSADPSSRSDGRLLAAARHTADLQVTYLIAQDQFIQRCEETDRDRATLDALREGRTEVARRLHNTLIEIERLTTNTEQPPPQ